MKLLRNGLHQWSGALLAVSVSLFSQGANASPFWAAASGKKPPAAAGAAKKRAAGTPPSSTSKPGTPSTNAARDGSPSAEGGPIEFADAHPGGTKVTPPDLKLVEEGTRKADALVAFAQAVVAGDAAETDKELAGYRKALALDPGHTELAVKVAY